MKILTQAQAEAIYTAICALNNVCGNGVTYIRDSRYIYEVRASWDSVGVEVAIGSSLKEREQYDNQTAFADAYGIQHG